MSSISGVAYATATAPLALSRKTDGLRSCRVGTAAQARAPVMGGGAMGRCRSPARSGLMSMPLTSIYVKPRNAVTCDDPRPVLDVQLAPGCLRCYLAGLSARGWDQPAVLLVGVPCDLEQMTVGIGEVPGVDAERAHMGGCCERGAGGLGLPG